MQPWQLIIARTVPWAKANLNYTGQTLVISAGKPLRVLFLCTLRILLFWSSPFFSFVYADVPSILLTYLYPSPFCLVSVLLPKWLRSWSYLLSRI